MGNVSPYYAGIEGANPSNFVVKDSDNKYLLRLNPNYSLKVDDSTPPNLVIENAEGKKVLLLSSNFFVGKSENSPFNFVIKDLVKEREFFQINTDGAMTLPYQPSFEAYLSKTVLDQTGKGREATFIPDKTFSNIGNHYNSKTGEFTIPVKGRYQFECAILTTSDKRYDSFREHHGKIFLTVGDRKYSDTMGPVYEKSGVRETSTRISWTGVAEAAQKVICSIQIFDIDKNNLDFVGSESLINSRFSGYLIG